MTRRLSARYSRVELQQLLDREGVALTGETRKDGTFLTLTAPAGHTAVMGALVRELLSEPAFPAAEWLDVKQELTAELTASQDQPQAVALDALNGLIFPGTPYGAGLEATRKSLESLDPAALARFHRAHYRAERISVAYSGPASREIVAAALAGRWGPTQPEGAPAPRSFAAAAPQKVARAPVAMAGKKQVNLYWAWPGAPITSDDWILWQLAQRALGGDLAGRLWQLRQKEGLAYSVWFQDQSYRDRPLTMIYMATAAEKYPAAIAALDRELSRAAAGINAEELARVKTSYLAALERQDASVQWRSWRHAFWRLMGLPADQRARLRRVVSAATLDEVNRVLKSTLDAGRFYKAEAGALP
jgi:zinc protease